jgi:thiol:disulfide interchange protein
MKLTKGIVFFALGLGIIGFLHSSFRVQDKTTNTDKTVGIAFADLSLVDAKALAKKKKKIIFIDAYASWCGPCKLLDKNTFSDASVGTYFNEKFINLKIDCEKHPDGRTVASTYSVSAYPTLIWIDADGNLVKKEVGYKNPEQLLRAVQDLK